MEQERLRIWFDKYLSINEFKISSVIIDPHVNKHKDHIDLELILNLVRILNGKTYIPTHRQMNYKYFVSNVLYQKKSYRLVWLLEENENYIGVITAFRDRRLENEAP